VDIYRESWAGHPFDGLRTGLGERREAIQLLEDTQEEVGRLEALEATEVLVVLIKASND